MMSERCVHNGYKLTRYRSSISERLIEPVEQGEQCLKRSALPPKLLLQSCQLFSRHQPRLVNLSDISLSHVPRHLILVVALTCTSTLTGFNALALAWACTGESSSTSGSSQSDRSRTAGLLAPSFARRCVISTALAIHQHHHHDLRHHLAPHSHPLLHSPPTPHVPAHT